MSDQQAADAAGTSPESIGATPSPSTKSQGERKGPRRPTGSRFARPLAPATGMTATETVPTAVAMSSSPATTETPGQHGVMAESPEPEPPTLQQQSTLPAVAPLQVPIVTDTSPRREPQPAQLTAPPRLTPSSPRPKRTARLSPGWAREAVDEAALAAHADPDVWVTTSVRLAVDVKRTAERQLAQQRRQTGFRYHLNYFLDAGIARLPDDPAALLQIVEEYRRGFGLAKPITRGTTMNLRRSTVEKYQDFSNWLIEEGRQGVLWVVQTVALKRVVDALQVEGTDVPDLDRL